MIVEKDDGETTTKIVPDVHKLMDEMDVYFVYVVPSAVTTTGTIFKEDDRKPTLVQSVPGMEVSSQALQTTKDMLKRIKIYLMEYTPSEEFENQEVRKLVKMWGVY